MSGGIRELARLVYRLVDTLINTPKFLLQLARFLVEVEAKYDTSKANLRGGLAVVVLVVVNAASAWLIALIHALRGSHWVSPPYWQGIAWLVGYYVICVLAISCIEARQRTE